ncbi:MAG: FeS cluster assembly protein SufD [Chlamydiae bacterium]|nr:FeS cluster assembly protein SufD [Chlamydiota bacterium]
MKKLKLISSVLFDALTKQYHAKKDRLFFVPLAYQKFLELGLPTKQNECYRNMGLKRLNDLNLVAAPQKKCLTQKGITLFNGKFVASQEKLFCQPIQEANAIFGAFLYPFYTSLLDEETDPFYAISTALCSGVVIHVSKERVSTEPIHIYNITDLQKNQSVFPKIIFILEKGAKLNVVYHHNALEEGFCFVTFDCIMQENSKLNLQQIHLDHTSHFSFVRVQQKRDSLFKSLHVTKGAPFCLNDYKVQLTQENAECFLNGLWMLNGKQRAHTNAFVEHQAPYCRSFQHFKGVLLEQSRSYFEGNSFVHNQAQKTDAFQLNQNLILSDDAIAHAKPKLEIFADDVKASHGSNTVQIEQELLFYLQTRGISKKRAKAFLIEAFCKEMLEKVKIETVKEALLEDAQILSTT